jgi:uncharacterized protein YjbI with pentapeptide repeats
MSDVDGVPSSTLQRPTTKDRDVWKAYWREQGWPWRTEPEIDEERKAFLTERLAVTPNVEQGIYSFKDVKLSRADVEWLLASHEQGKGPVDWSDEHEQERLGLDLRGADLRGVNLQRLPLIRLRGGLDSYEWHEASEAQREMAAIRLEEADLRWVRLEGAHLRWAHLERAVLGFAHLERTHLRGAYLVGTDLRDAYLESARLEDAVLGDDQKRGPRLADVKWGEVNLTIMKWSQVAVLGDEIEAKQKQQYGKLKSAATQLSEYEMAVRANRQLAIALQAQGLNEDAARFGYRAQTLQRVVLRRQRKFWQYLFSLFLDVLAGYGYKPIRSVLWYLAVIIGFGLLYNAFGRLSLFPPDAFVYSLTSFHGRGFFPGLDTKPSLHDPLVMLAAVEAVVGLLIEISFIATFTQRFFGK